jgi:hypothetical protein
VQFSTWAVVRVVPLGLPLRGPETLPDDPADVPLGAASENQSLREPVTPSQWPDSKSLSERNLPAVQASTFQTTWSVSQLIPSYPTPVIQTVTNRSIARIIGKWLLTININIWVEEFERGKCFALCWSSYWSSGFSLLPVSRLVASSYWNPHKAASHIVIWNLHWCASNQIASLYLLYETDFDIETSCLFSQLRTVCLDLNSELTSILVKTASEVTTRKYRSWNVYSEVMMYESIGDRKNLLYGIRRCSRNHGQIAAHFCSFWYFMNSQPKVGGR